LGIPERTSSPDKVGISHFFYHLVSFTRRIVCIFFGRHIRWTHDAKFSTGYFRVIKPLSDYIRDSIALQKLALQVFGMTPSHESLVLESKTY